MPIISDARTAVRLAERLFRSRRSRRDLARKLPSAPVPAPGTIEIAVYFADGPVNMYQVRQWYAPLAELAATHPVAIVSRSPGTMLKLLEESPVPAVYARQVVDLERFVDEQAPKVVLYVNQNARNFQMMRYGRMWHVFVNHGESDKMYMTTNQFKAYDYALIAGDAARDRLADALWDYDLDTRALAIGRPQADHFAGAVPYPSDDRTVVLYAPTWEGDRPAAAYGSIASHGTTIADRVLASPQHRLVYRPHPRSGVRDAAYKAAHERIVAAIARANAADPSAHHVYDDGPELGWQLADADVAITDISAMIYDRLAVGKPLVVTRPVAREADVDERGYLGDANWLRASDASDVVARVDAAANDAAELAKLQHWVRRYFGDTTPGAATARFHDAVELLLRRWDEVATARGEA
ncbi:CDP-glycerol:poly(glycerophosphate) glycerophosphotransferase [Curtobacterium flaccumfaciens]|uniref:CDP-glycerol:poly(Glycerophosphate) glycerophosphotransferase n=1 Tax=Curtobacterium flaccumfaciens TaxID=2035 RepID=A0A4R6DN90_9MICO|nr:CDP-glycerol glycerophosphotransferase family protein [Curtobacterium flaccumfaciens]TDN46337.1 CDP-glycerol:poly(glycerophosphate) glycerophosphotransferase [Curtobacterium flaccumfaciens]